ncbi:MAG: ATP-binding protein, partial [Saezia sp.]
DRNPLCDPLPMYNYDPNTATAYFVQVQLIDEQWATFDTLVFKEKPMASSRLMRTLVFMLLGIFLLLYLSVRWVTRPLKILAEAADTLGVDLNKPPIPEKGPDEIKRAAHAFNTMQERLRNLIQDRTHIFAAMSHDLKTPITRLRLRSELLEDDGLRESFEKDLKEMEVMVNEALSFMRGIDATENLQPVNINALFESLQEDYQEMGKKMSLNGKAMNPLMGYAPLLKRCLVNLINNAIFYGKEAHITLADSTNLLTIRIRDDGPGIPEQELNKVFNPFYRLEQSRNRETGGTGLGLPIARNIIHLHGGKISLSNHKQGGLEVTLTLPRLLPPPA